MQSYGLSGMSEVTNKYLIHDVWHPAVDCFLKIKKFIKSILSVKFNPMSPPIYHSSELESEAFDFKGK